MFGRLVMSLLLSIFTMNYTKANNTYFAVPKDDPRDRIHLEVGDSKQSDFHPQMKIMRWDNEVNFSMRLVHSEKSPKVSKAGNKIKWQGDKTEAHFYDLPFSEELPEGGHECEILIYEPVPDNRIEFTIKYKNLRFYYQDFDFTPEEIAEGAILGSRPEHIKGSYAVYTATPKTNYEGGKLYRCNKVGHIPRPRLEDAVGKWCWGILNIETIDAENAILRVAMPKDFADTAVYPIRHAAGATFGYTTGGTAGSTAYTDCRAMIGASYIHAAVTGETVTKFSMWAKSSGGSTGYDMAAYSMSGGLPVTRLGTPVTVVLPTTSPPVAFTDSAEVSQAMTNGVSYCCAFGNDGSGTETLYWDTGSGNMRSNDTTTGAMPPTWTHSAYSAALMSIYATYSAGSTLSGTQAESAGAVDAQSATNIAVASQAESASAVDAPSATKTTAASQVESAGAVDAQSGVTTTAANQAEAAGAVDAQSGVITTAVTQSESAGAVDSQSATIQSAGGGISRVAGQACGNSSYTYSVSKAFPNDITAGNLIVVCVRIGHTPILSEISKLSGTATLGAWTLDKAYYDDTQNQAIGIYSAPVTGTGSCTIQWSQDQSDYNYPSIALQEYAGADVSGSRVQGFNTGTNSTGAPATATVDSVAGGVFVGALSSNYEGVLTITPGADFVQIYEQEDGNEYCSCAFEDRIVTSGTVDAADWQAPTTNPWVAAVVVYKAGGGGGSTLSGTQAESAGAVDAQSATTIAVASQAESAGAVDAQSGVTTTAANQAEAAGAVDAQSGVTTTAANQAEAAGAVDAQSGATTTAASQSESAGAVDAQSGATTTAASQSESAGAVDAQSGVTTTAANQAEAAGAVDAQSAIKTTGTSQVEAAGAVDTQSAIAVAIASQAESAGAADAQSATTIAVASQAESAGAIDTQSATVYSSTNATQEESAGATDAQSAIVIAVANQAESASAVDAPSATKTTAASQVESAGAVDVQSGVMTTAASQAEAAGAVDIPSATKTTGASQVEAAGAVDAQSGVTTTAASQIESVGAVDVQSATIIAVAIQAESAGATDLISATKIIADAKNWLRSGYWWNYPYN